MLNDFKEVQTSFCDHQMTIVKYPFQNQIEPNESSLIQRSDYLDVSLQDQGVNLGGGGGGGAERSLSEWGLFPGTQALRSAEAFS